MSIKVKLSSTFNLETPKKDRESLSRHLRAGRGHHSVVEWATINGVNKNTVSGYERAGPLPEVEYLAKHAESARSDFLSILIARLLASDDEITRKQAMPLTMIHGILGDDTNSSSILVLDENSDRPKKVAYTRASNKLLVSLGVSDTNSAAATIATDDSMAPTICKGDILLIDGHLHKPGEGVYMLKLSGNQPTCRRLQMLPGHIRVSPDNTHYEQILLDEKSFHKKIRVIGKVVHVWSGRRL